MAEPASGTEVPVCWRDTDTWRSRRTGMV